MRYYLINILIVLFSCKLHSQNLSGRVTERNSAGKDISVFGAIVYWLNSTTGTTTDTSGFFSIKKDSLSTKLIVSYIGYENDTITVSKISQTINIALHALKSLEVVEVTGHQASSYFQSMNPIGTQIMGEGELKKAACCNLSESFETNPSIDVNYSDAVTGVKQIQMLGLSGTYSPVTVELIPLTRGLSSHVGLTFIPGPWIESIQVTKGIGPVSSGYESVAGQINVELKKPDKADKLYLNVYQNSMGRSEANILFNTKLNKRWSTGLMIHGSSLFQKNDMNKDNFLDLPLGKQINVLNRWKYENTKGFIAQFGAHIVTDDKQGGTLNYTTNDVIIDSTQYRYTNTINRYEGFAKIGYVLPGSVYKSVGFIANAYRNEQNSVFGNTKYNGDQQSLSSQLLYQSIIGNTNHKYKTGISFLFDNYNEQYKNFLYYRTESVIGGFFEYTYNSNKKFDLIAGIRYDHNNLFGNIITPRIHAKYNITSKTFLRASFGRGQRVANIFAENTALMASSRSFVILPSSNNATAYGLQPEVAWNSGLNLIHNFKLNYREGSIILDFYRTDFVNQVVVDMDKDPQQVQFYNLSGKSYSNSFQAEVNYEPLRRFDVKIAYRLFDVKTTYHSELLQKPYVARNRAFLNLAYKTKSKWHFDYTLNYFGQKRLPSTLQNPVEYRQVQSSPAYFTMNAQISKLFLKQENLDVYVGCENITGYRQNNLILSADRPFGKYFDSSLIWGPVIGRMFYIGVRYNLPSKKI